MRTHDDGPRYVIASNAHMESRYWSKTLGWTMLDTADRYDRAAVSEGGLPSNGFWMPLERAEELESEGAGT